CQCSASLAHPLSLFLHTRPPPRPTLFPYTTLFRSTLCDKGCRYPNFRRTSQRARKFGRRPQLRFVCFCRWQRLSFAVLSVSRPRSEEHTSELQSRFDLVCRLLLEKKKDNSVHTTTL